MAMPETVVYSSFLDRTDPEIAQANRRELLRQRTSLELIASENFTSLAVMTAQGGVMTNKYAEGYPGRRYYGGCEFVDMAEQLAIERAKKLFGCSFVNVQPHSGAQANQEVFLALLKPGDSILGMSLNSGGHLTHGSSVNMSGKWFQAHGYDVRQEDGYIDTDQVARLARKHKPKLMIAGGSAYPRILDFKWFRDLADEVGAYLLVDMAHFAGLVAGGVFPNPLPHAHVVTTTTHKTLRGPRGGMILSNDEALGKKLNAAVFPGNQGGPLMHVIAAKAVAFKEALDPSFKKYAAQVIANCKALGKVLTDRGLDLVTGGTDCHLLLADLRPLGLDGRSACDALEAAHITANKNGVPFDPLPPVKTSGLRFGSPALTTRGFKETDFERIGHLIMDVLQGLAAGAEMAAIEKARLEVKKLTDHYPLYPELGAEG